MFTSDAIPDFISLTGLLKATPAQEGGERFVYLEVSNENIDATGERVLASALQEGAKDYERFGNVDIDHLTVVGSRMGIKDYLLYEVGRPLAVRINGKHTYVKAQLYQGDTEVARQANLVWDSLTKISPPARWYPSVGGAVLEKGFDLDPQTGARIAVVKKVRWTNTALSRTPVNQTLPTAATVPFGAFVKCWGANGLNLTKALEAGQTYNLEDASGGQALRQQSLDRHLQNYWTWRDQFAAEIRDGKVKPTRGNLPALLKHVIEHHGLPSDRAAEFLHRFFADLDHVRNAK